MHGRCCATDVIVHGLVGGEMLILVDTTKRSGS